jgi:hypothetical protein
MSFLRGRPLLHGDFCIGSDGLPLRVDALTILDVLRASRAVATHDKSLHFRLMQSNQDCRIQSRSHLQRVSERLGIPSQESRDER